VPDRLPDLPLRSLGPAAAACLAHGLRDYRAAAACVSRLPYGRGRGRDDLAILAEGRGTCSTKHALLARLAHEHGVAVELVLGIYLMDGSNTPGVGETLAAHGLTAIPEAHCVLRWRGEFIDLTRPGIRDPPSFLHAQVISPADIVARKLEIHRDFLATWLPDHLPAWTLERLWQAREACIAALAP
jgi:hypothetical protein